jgi:hypothetical protein
MLARTHNQRILGYYDTTPRMRMAKQIHCSMEAAEKAAEDIDSSLPLSWVSKEKCFWHKYIMAYMIIPMNELMLAILQMVQCVLQ